VHDVGKIAHRLHMAKVANYVLADRDSEPYYVAVHIPGSKVKKGGQSVMYSATAVSFTVYSL